MPRVLIVDDAPDTVELLTRQLAERGYEVLPAGGALEALKLIERAVPDLALIDLVMPGLDGVELARLLHRRPATSALPIIIVTASGDPRQRLRALEAGVIEVLAKPIDPFELQARVSSLLRLKSLGEELAQAREELARQQALAEAAGQIRALSLEVVRSQEAERQRLALSLHDSAGQMLTALLYKLHEAAARTAEPATAARLGPLAALAGELLEELRRLSHALWPAALDRLGVADALRDLADTFDGEAVKVTCTVAPQPFPAVGPDAALALYRIAQAAITNALRHAGARRIALSLDAASGSAVLAVEDDGRGFDPSSAQGRGLGLLGMRERAQWLGGRFDLTSAVGRGTRIRVELPLTIQDRTGAAT